jgi:hypothetical protein
MSTGLAAISPANDSADQDVVAASMTARGSLEEKANDFAAGKKSYDRALARWQEIPTDKLSSQDRGRIAQVRDRLAACERALAGQ